MRASRRGRVCRALVAAVAAVVVLVVAAPGIALAFSAFLYEPPEDTLPFAIVAYDAGGREVAREPIPRDALYVD